MEDEAYKKSVEWLRQCVPPDDIYEFAEQALMACDCFLTKLNENTTILPLLMEDKNFAIHVNNILGIRLMKQDGVIVILNLDPTTEPYNWKL